MDSPQNIGAKYKMDNVVYILDAGFSASLGLPTMSDFISKSKDLYGTDKTKYSHFIKVFDYIKILAYIKEYFNIDLDNIEEILSIIEIQRQVGQLMITEETDFRRFIVDVIENYTPPIELPVFERFKKGKYVNPRNGPHDKWIYNFFGNYGNYAFYAGFVASLFNTFLEINDVDDDVFAFEVRTLEKPLASYSVITLNYDMVLENLAKHISMCTDSSELEFARASNEFREGSPCLVKLHGSVDNKYIIPPTWNKSIDKYIEKEWKMAFELLGAANHIRILGYSLPENDAYVRYLLKASILRTDNLKKIDVLCKDATGNVKNKFEEFVNKKYPKFRFSDQDIMEYLRLTVDLGRPNHTIHVENRHHFFFSPEDDRG